MHLQSQNSHREVEVDQHSEIPRQANRCGVHSGAVETQRETLLQLGGRES